MSQAPEQLFQFKDGFPVEQSPGSGARIAETVAALRAYERGILYVEVEDATLGVEQGLKSDGLLPIVLDYATHVLGSVVEWRFKSGLENETVKRYIESMDSDSPWSLQDMVEAVRDKMNRPALVNEQSSEALMDARTSVREKAGVPMSVTLLMMDMALENMHQMSCQYQQQLMGEPLPDTLDLTPTIEMLNTLEVHPRANLPASVRESALQRSAQQQSQSATNEANNNILKE